MNNINPVILELLHKRGISDESDILEFLSDKPQKTYDPFLLLNMEAGVDLILAAVKQGKKICVYGDYDADGITSTCLMLGVLKNIGANAEYYIPSRFDEGYGLNMSAIKAIYDRGAELIITVDCGSVSFEEVEYAKELGLEIVITDHHSITDVIADCIVINPRQPECEYPFKNLAGVGVAFKLAQAIQQKANLPKTVLTNALDLVAIGTIGDVVPLIDENRTLVKYGIKELNRFNRKGLRELASAIGLKTNLVTSENIAFIIVPHLNAVGRMLYADAAVELLISEEETSINENVKKLVECNRQRKQVQEETYENCIKIVEGHLQGKNCLTICSPDAHEGIAGIVAGKIKDKYNRPTIIITQSGDLCKGTGRSLDNINMYELLKNFDELFIKFGGHSGACGFLMEQEDVGILKSKLEETLCEMLEENPEIFFEDFNFDMKILGQDVTIELGELIECLAPFGSQNKKPAFRINDVRVKDFALMGDDGKHLRINGQLYDGKVLQCVLFNKADEYKEVLENSKQIDLIGSIEVQTWNGNKRVQFIVDKIVGRKTNDN